MLDLLEKRERGELHVSIGTSKALESLLLSQDIKIQTMVRDVTEVWINIRTLIRNILSSLTQDLVAITNDTELANMTIDEVETIITQIRSIRPQLKPVFYYCHYDELKQLYPNAFFRIPKTEKQLFHQALLENTAKNLKAYFRDQEVLFLNLEIKPFVEIKAAILTHYPIDLTQEKHFKELLLIESHTGAVKPRSDWYTKFSSPEKNPAIPFRRCMLAIFGDNELFKPQRLQLRKTIDQLAHQYKWSSVTTLERIRLNISFLSDTELKHELLKFIH